LATIIQIFSVIAFVITCLGLFGQTIQICINRTKEIGVRKAVGATTAHIGLMLTTDFTKDALKAILVAIPLGWLFMRLWLQNFAYRIDLTIWPFLLAGLAALGIALFAVSWQTIRAATANPVEALRYE
jgi:putative ABC transport system permease protein